ncbi:GntR family transcriptional regulator [Lacticaseibacillus daqingensis]|uniref:GntR family transcriptional regulator n=1 Tax=Lacticaseibacillus daqingensis TaxID=2486014 RepID=UPI000F7B8648|nr:GntR family transcriptional regulator [Lacticaseibacillus daqingensis]
MHFDASSIVPLYQQITTQFTAGILSGAFPEGEQVPSTTEVARAYALNPATVLRGMNALVDAGLLEKRRGIGMFVVAGAQAQLRQAAQADFFDQRVGAVVAEAKTLAIPKAALVAAIERGYEE